jgi:hypothetical protein
MLNFLQQVMHNIHQYKFTTIGIWNWKSMINLFSFFLFQAAMLNDKQLSPSACRK